MRLALAEERTANILPYELERTFELHHAMVFRTAYRVTGNAADAEDVMQTVFLRLLHRDRAAAEMLAPESYLRRAAVNVAIDLVRKRRQDGAAPLREMAGREEEWELRDQLRRAVARLEGRQAEIFALRFFEGYGNGEIAEMLGISRVVVAVTVHRVRARLERELKAGVRRTEQGRAHHERLR